MTDHKDLSNRFGITELQSWEASAHLTINSFCDDIYFDISFKDYTPRQIAAYIREHLELNDLRKIIISYTYDGEIDADNERNNRQRG